MSNMCNTESIIGLRGTGWIISLNYFNLIYLMFCVSQIENNLVFYFLKEHNGLRNKQTNFSYTNICLQETIEI